MQVFGFKISLVSTLTLYVSFTDLKKTDYRIKGKNTQVKYAEIAC